MEPVLIDTDAGSDDALAIWMAVAAHRDAGSRVKVVGITCGHGNTQVGNVVGNVVRVLGAVGEFGIPVYRGASDPLVHAFTHQVDKFHGEDGFGDNQFRALTQRERAVVAEEHGVVAIVRLAREYRGQLKILALAPLTNLAMAARLDPEVCDIIKSVYVMGGNVEGEGNSTVSAEFNFSVDPEAAHITLSSYACPIYLVPWEVTKNAAFPHDWRVKVLGGIDSPQAKLLNKVEAKILEKYKDGWIACDQFAAAAAIRHDVILSSTPLHCTVELAGNWTRGLLVVDKNGILNRAPNVHVITELDVEVCKELMVWGMGGGECKRGTGKLK